MDSSTTLQSFFELEESVQIRTTFLWEIMWIVDITLLKQLQVVNCMLSHAMHGGLDGLKFKVMPTEDSIRFVFFGDEPEHLSCLEHIVCISIA